MKQFLVFSAIVLYLISVLFPMEELIQFTSILCILIIGVHLLTAKKFVKILSSIFLLLGVMMLWKSGASWETYLFSFGKMLNLLSLFALLPLVALPIDLGHYAVGVQRLIQKKVSRAGAMYIITSSLSYILSSFLNLATLPMMYHSIRPSVDLFPIKQKERFMSRAITHGFSMPLIWTPIAPIVGIVVDMTKVSWNSIVPILLLVSILGLILDWMMGAWLASKRKREMGFPTNEEWEKSRAEIAVTLDEQTEHKHPRHPIHIIFGIVIFNATILIAEKFTTFDFLFLVTIVVVPFSFLWSLLIGRGRQFMSMSQKNIPVHLMKMKEQFVIFLSAGFFLTAMKMSGLGHDINLWLMDLIQVIGPAIFVLFIPFIPLILAFTGLHPAVGLALVAESLNPQVLGISSEIVAIAMLTGAATAFLMGPYNATIGIMSNMINETPYKVSNWNAPFTIMYLLMVMGILTLLQLQ